MRFGLFCYAKEKNVPLDKKGQLGYGDMWTWTAIGAASKLSVSWLVGGRVSGWALDFVDDVASRLQYRVHHTLKTTPAVVLGQADHVRTIDEIVGLLDSN